LKSTLRTAQPSPASCARLKGEVRFDDGARALYATDASNYRQVPIGVVIPKNTDDIIQTVAVARAHGAPVLARGGGTSLAGQCCNAAIVMDTSKYLNQLIEIDATPAHCAGSTGNRSGRFESSSAKIRANVCARSVNP